MIYMTAVVRDLHFLCDCISYLPWQLSNSTLFQSPISLDSWHWLGPVKISDNY